MDSNVSLENAILYDSDLWEITFVSVFGVADHLLNSEEIIS